MPMSEAPVDLASFFDIVEPNRETFEKYADMVFETARSYERFADLIAQYANRTAGGSGDPLKAGFGFLILGRFQQALEWLEKAGDGKYARFYAAQAAVGLNRHKDAIAHYQKAAHAGWDRFEIDMLVAETHIKAGDESAAEKLIEARHSDGADRCEWYYVRGTLAERRNCRDEALELYQKSLTLKPEYTPAMFRAAWLFDLVGDDDRAIDLYEDLACQPRAYVNALINLAVIYEDRGYFDNALSCLHRVLKAFPNHHRARLFAKDVESSREMVIDDLREKQVESRNRLLETPVSEFELSVRARNCLKKMNIQTLGDLLRLNETELMSYKNFGETSLQEIRILLSRRGLHLGQKPEEIDALSMVQPPAAPKINVPPGSEALLTKPVSEMELSVRARRCLQRLNIDKLGDLIQRTESELLATRNFGVTSLNEIKARLTELGLNLAGKA
jgi:DNA-directed RNA polymerase subunit alpha